MQEKEGEEQFERMQEASGMSSTAQLVDAYVTAEAANFELFNQVAGINTQTAQLQELIVQQQLLISRLRYASVIGQTCHPYQFKSTDQRATEIHKWLKADCH